VGDRTLVCRVTKEGNLTKWICEEVPFEGIVKEEGPQFKHELVDFKRHDTAEPDDH
jgi:hypothetical protein